MYNYGIVETSVRSPEEGKNFEIQQDDELSEKSRLH